MLGWAIKISIISILLIMIFHYSQFCFKQDVFAKQTATNDDLKVQKYKNIISALSKQTPQVHHSDGKQTPQVHQSDLNQSDIAIEDMSMDLMDYLNQKTTLPEVINLEAVIIPEILQPKVLQPEILQPEILQPKVLQPDSAESEILQLDITEINQ